MCCLMRVSTNNSSLMDEAMREWSKDTYYDGGLVNVFKGVGVGLEAIRGSAQAVFSLNGAGHGCSPESWVAAVKGVTTLYNWGLRLTSTKDADPSFGVLGSVPRWTAEHMSEPCEESIVGENGHAIDLTLFCWASAPMGLLKAEAMVISDRREKVETPVDEFRSRVRDVLTEYDEPACVCGCNDDCGEESEGG